ncbi:DUF3829 domain-containing protein [Variovorax boronicumulans]|uniref:DUF3829 domain-containing protein n=1 Tax=Variovorax boronicumulans TaxID=436515 RepID=UPI0036F2A8E8
MTAHNNRSARTRLFALSLCFCAVLAACKEDNKPTPAAASPSPSASGKTQPAKDPARVQAAARTTYSQGYNRLIDDNRSVGAKYKSYVQMNVNGKSPSGNSFYGSPSDVQSIVDDLKKARADGSGDAALDAAVDGVVATGEKLVAVWTPMDPYYRSKSFLEDKWVKGRAADADMNAAFKGLLASIDTLGGELDRVQEASRTERMAKLKAEGDMLNYHTLASMAVAKKFVNGLDQIDGLKNKDAVAKVDAAASELQASLEELSKALEEAKAAAKAKGEAGKAPNYNYESLHGSLLNMIGQWRTFKDSKFPSTYKNIVSYYNSAVGSYNRGFGR